MEEHWWPNQLTLFKILFFSKNSFQSRKKKQNKNFQKKKKMFCQFQFRKFIYHKIESLSFVSFASSQYFWANSLEIECKISKPVDAVESELSNVTNI